MGFLEEKMHHYRRNNQKAWDTSYNNSRRRNRTLHSNFIRKFQRSKLQQNQTSNDSPQGLRNRLYQTGFLRGSCLFYGQAIERDILYCYKQFRAHQKEWDDGCVPDLCKEGAEKEYNGTDYLTDYYPCFSFSISEIRVFFKERC